MHVYLPDKHPCHRQQGALYHLQADHRVSYRQEQVSLDVAVTVCDQDGVVLPEAVMTEEAGQSFVNEGVSYLRVLSSHWRVLPADPLRLEYSSFAECLQDLMFKRRKEIAPVTNARISVVDVREAKALQWKSRSKVADLSRPARDRARCLARLHDGQSQPSSRLQPSQSQPSIDLRIFLLESLSEDLDENEDEEIRFHVENWVCCYCNDMGFKTLNTLSQHLHSPCPSIPIETTSLTSECLICGLLLPSSKELKSHVLGEHAETSSFFPCIQCKKHFYTMEEKSRHDTTVHSPLTQPSSIAAAFACPFCPKSFSLAGRLNRHTRSVHAEDRPHSCEICGEAFKIREALTKHRKVHGGEENRSHACTFCSKRFRTASNLKQHLSYCERINRPQQAAALTTVATPQTIAKPPQTLVEESVPELKAELVEVGGVRYRLGFPPVEELTAEEVERLERREREEEEEVDRVVPLFIEEEEEDMGE